MLTGNEKLIYIVGRKYHWMRPPVVHKCWTDNIRVGGTEAEPRVPCLLHRFLAKWTYSYYSTVKIIV
jgi:hypothetical protein